MLIPFHHESKEKIQSPVQINIKKLGHEKTLHTLYLNLCSLELHCIFFFLGSSAVTLRLNTPLMECNHKFLDGQSAYPVLIVMLCSLVY